MPLFLLLFFTLPLTNETYYNYVLSNQDSAIEDTVQKEKRFPWQVKAEEDAGDIDSEAEDAEEPTSHPEMPEDFAPSESHLQPQWNHNVMNIGQAWADGFTGKGIKIAILDTGFYHEHPDLSMAGGYSVFPDDAWSNDHSGHGTHIAGIIGAERGSTYQGIAPDSEIYGIKIYHEEDVDENGSVSTSTESVIKGVREAIEIDADIILISSGLSYHDDDLYDIIKEAHDQNIMIIAASGNGKSSVNYPASYDEVIAVTAIDEELNPAIDIIYGQENEFCAPGVNIGGLSIPESTYSYPYIFMSGSSQAAPHAAGLAAILMEKYGERGEDIRKIMQEQAVEIGDSGLFGYGLLNYELKKVAEEKEVEESDQEETAPSTDEKEEDEEDKKEKEDADEEEPTLDDGVQKPESSREADTDEEDLLEYHETEAIIAEDGEGTLEEDILELIEPGGTLEVWMDTSEVLHLTEKQVSQIRNNNIALILAREEASWTIPPANFVLGEATLRFYEGVPTGVPQNKDAGPPPYTISIYQDTSRSDAFSYPGWMEVQFDLSNSEIEDLSKLRAYYWNKDKSEWVSSESEVDREERSFTLRTRHTTAVGFFNPKLITRRNENHKNKSAVHKEEQKSFISSLYQKILIGAGIFLLLLVSAALLIRRKR